MFHMIAYSDISKDCKIANGETATSSIARAKIYLGHGVGNDQHLRLVWIKASARGSGNIMKWACQVVGYS